jgi:hypothetical protein
MHQRCLYAPVLVSSCRELTIKTILPPRKRFSPAAQATFAPCYLNAYLANDAVITGKFDDPERGEAARAALQQTYASHQNKLRLAVVAYTV